MELKSLREDADLTTRELAGYVGITYGYISLMEKEKKSPTTEVIEKLCNYFKVDIAYMLCGVGSFVLGNGDICPSWFYLKSKAIEEVTEVTTEGGIIRTLNGSSRKAFETIKKLNSYSFEELASLGNIIK